MCEVQEDVDRAAEMIEDLLQPQDESRMEHKRMQLRELAALNGTLKDEDVRSLTFPALPLLLIYLSMNTGTRQLLL